MDKQDHMGTCNNLRISEEDFARVWCARCIQAECVRALPFENRFDARVHTWQERLFEDVPRMDPSDPRFQGISAKRFVEIPLRTPEVRSTWIEPDAPPLAVVDQKPPLAAPVESPAPNPVQGPAEPSSPPQRPAIVAPGAAKGLALGNTRVEQGRMIPGAPPPAPVKDAWEAPVQGVAPVKSDEVVVTPGARVRLGRGTGV